MADTSKVRKLGKGLAGLIGAPAAVPVPPQVDAPTVENKLERKSIAIEQKPTYIQPAGGAPATAGGQLRDGGGGDIARGAPAATPSPGVAKPPPPSSADAGEGGVMPYVVVRIDEVVANRFQPRQEFDRAGLQALAGSIKRDGVMQPLVVRKAKSEGGSRKAEVGGVGGTKAKWELIAGERRLRAAQMAGLTHVPAVVVDVPDITAAMWAVVENVQRVDLGPLEKSQAYARLANEFGLTQSQIAEQVGEDRTLVSHYIRLGELEPKIIDFIRAGMLTFGHAKVLGSPQVKPGETRELLADRVVLEAMSVRQLELMVQAGAGKDAGAAMMMRWGLNGPEMPGAEGGESRKLKAESRNEGSGGGAALSAAESEHARAVKRAEEFEAKAGVRDLEERIGKHLGTKVKIRTSGGGKRGVVSIEFFSLDHFEGLLGKLGVKKAD